MITGNTPKAQLKILTVAINNGYVSKRALRLMGEVDSTRSKALHSLLNNGFLSKTTLNYDIINDEGKKKYYSETAYHINIYQYKKAKEHFGKLLEDVEEIPLRSAATSRSKSNNIRALRRSEQMMMLQEIGCNIYPDESATNIRYFTKEELMKEIETEDPQRMKYIRAYGCIATEHQLYILYDLNRNSFAKLEDWIESLAYKSAVKKTNLKCEAKRIVFAENEKKLRGVMEKNVVTFSSKGMARHYMSDTSLYKETLFIPKTIDGERQLDILLMPNIKETLAKYLGLSPLPRTSTVDADGIKDDKYVLNFMYPDIAKLKRFERGLEGKEHLGQIHCYSYIAEELRELYPKIEIVEHDIDEVYNHILMEAI